MRTLRSRALPGRARRARAWRGRSSPQRAGAAHLRRIVGRRHRSVHVRAAVLVRSSPAIALTNDGRRDRRPRLRGLRTPWRSRNPASILAAPGVYAGITVFAGRRRARSPASAAACACPGLTINGQGGDIGIHFQQGAKLAVDHCAISDLILYGIYVQAGEFDVDRHRHDDRLERELRHSSPKPATARSTGVARRKQPRTSACSSTRRRTCSCARSSATA